LSDKGFLEPVVLSNLDHHAQRPVIETYIDRLRRATEDAPLLIGTAKEVLETTARFVLHDLGRPVERAPKFGNLLHEARAALDLLPQSVNDTGSTARTVREIYDGLWKVAKAVNELRDKAGTGHGRIEQSEVSPEVARVVVQAAGLLGALMLDTLDARRASGSAPRPEWIASAVSSKQREPEPPAATVGQRWWEQDRPPGTSGAL
jgi:hypothetical protein